MDKLIPLTPENLAYLEEANLLFENLRNEANITTWNGYVFGANFPAGTIKYSYENWEPRDGDILIASYPKTGTTFTREIVRQLLCISDKDYCEATAEIPMPLLYLEVGPVSSFKLIDQMLVPRRVLVTHLPATLINMDAWKRKDTKVIYVMRNPKDQAVSWYNFSTRFPYGHLPPFDEIVSKNWDKWIKEHMAGNIPSNLKKNEFYPDHILTWLPYKDCENVKFLFYEEMLQDHETAVKQIADFIGCKPSTEVVIEVAEKTTFKAMKRKVDEGQTPFNEMMRTMQMFRKGKVGDWKNHFTVAQSEEMDQIIASRLQGSEIKFIYE